MKEKRWGDISNIIRLHTGGNSIEIQGFSNKQVQLKNDNGMLHRV